MENFTKISSFGWNHEGRRGQQFINRDAMAARVPRQLDTFDLIVIGRWKFHWGSLQTLIDCLSRKPGFRSESGSIMRALSLYMRHACTRPRISLNVMPFTWRVEFPFRRGVTETNLGSLACYKNLSIRIFGRLNPRTVENPETMGWKDSKIRVFEYSNPRIIENTGTLGWKDSKICNAELPISKIVLFG